jgi:hypothetical protein
MNSPVATAIASVNALVIKAMFPGPQAGSMNSIMALANPAKRSKRLMTFISKLACCYYCDTIA